MTDSSRDCIGPPTTRNHEENRRRLLWRARHLGALEMAEEPLWRRGHRLLCRCGTRRGTRRTGGESAHYRSLQVSHWRPQGTLRGRFHLPDVSSRRPLRRSVFVRHQHRPPLHQSRNGGGGPSRGRGGHRPWRHWKRQRSIPEETGFGAVMGTIHPATRDSAGKNKPLPCHPV